MLANVIPFLAFLAILASGLNLGSDGKKQEELEVVTEEPEVVVE